MRFSWFLFLFLYDLASLQYIWKKKQQLGWNSFALCLAFETSVNAKRCHLTLSSFIRRSWLTNRVRTDPQPIDYCRNNGHTNAQCNSSLLLLGAMWSPPQASSQFYWRASTKSGYAKLRHLSDDTLLFQLAPRTHTSRTKVSPVLSWAPVPI